MKVLELKGTKTDNYFFKYTENVWWRGLQYYFVITLFYLEKIQDTL